MTFEGEQAINNAAIAATTSEDDDVNSVLWVGNLDGKVTDAMLYELFLQAGPIKSIKIPKSADGNGHKGYCFIQFLHDASVPYTIDTMDGTTLFGKKLKLQPRPNSIHKKVLDQKKAEQRQELLQQQQQQWFATTAAPSQLAQVPPNAMLVYQNQVYQPYPQPNLNLNMQAIPFQPAAVGPPLMQIQIPQQTAAAVQGPPAPAQQPTMVRGSYQAGARTPVSVVQQPHHTTQLNGYVQFMQPFPGTAAATPTQPRNSTVTNSHNSGIPSHFTQATSGPPLFQQRHQQPRGPRPPRHSHHNGHVSNGNRLSYSNPHQQRYHPPQPQQQQQQQIQHPPPQPLYFNPMFQGQSVHVVPAGSPVDHQQNHVEPPAYFRRHPQQATAAAAAAAAAMQQPPFSPGVAAVHAAAAAAAANPVTNGFHNVLYHY